MGEARIKQRAAFAPHRRGSLPWAPFFWISAPLWGQIKRRSFGTPQLAPEASPATLVSALARDMLLVIRRHPK